MFIIVSERMPNIEGVMDHRPLAVFQSMEDARRYLRVLAANGIYASVKTLETGPCT